MLLTSSLLSTWWRRRYDNSIRAVHGPTLLMRFRLLAYVLAPFLPIEWAVPYLIVVTSLVSLPSGVASIIFLVMIREAVRDNRLTDLISRRQLAMNLCIAASTLVLGFWLERVAFPHNYQIMFIVGFGLMIVSLWHVDQVRVFNITPEPPPSREDPDSRPWHSPNFRNVALIVTVLFVSFQSIVPVIPLWLVQGRGAEEGFIALYSFLELIGAASGAMLAHRLIRRFGHRRVGLVGMLCTGMAALILAAAPSLAFTLPAALLSGGTWVMVDISQFTFFSARTPPEKRSSYTRAYFQSLSIATFLGPLIGSTLANSGVALPLVLVIGGGLRMGAGVLFFVRGARPVSTATPPAAPMPTPAR